MLTQTKGMHTSPVMSFSLTRFAAALLAVTGWIGMSLPSQAADIPTSVSRNQYRNCTVRLLRAGVSAEAAARGCAGALYPQDIGRCVTRIAQRTGIKAEDALATCTQVRRPIDVARCVVGISDTPGQPIPGVLNYCGRSLLPVNFAECVVGLRRQINLAADRALETCISASDRPLEFSPNFIPEAQPVPAQPTLPTEPQQTTPTAPAPSNQPGQTTPTAPAPSNQPGQTAPTAPAPTTP